MTKALYVRYSALTTQATGGGAGETRFFDDPIGDNRSEHKSRHRKLTDWLERELSAGRIIAVTELVER